MKHTYMPQFSNSTIYHTVMDDDDIIYDICASTNDDILPEQDKKGERKKQIQY